MRYMVRIPASPHKTFIVSESRALMFSPPFLTIDQHSDLRIEGRVGGSKDKEFHEFHVDVFFCILGH